MNNELGVKPNADYEQVEPEMLMELRLLTKTEILLLAPYRLMPQPEIGAVRLVVDLIIRPMKTEDLLSNKLKTYLPTTLFEGLIKLLSYKTYTKRLLKNELLCS